MKGRTRLAGGKARALVDLLHLIPAFDELAFDWIAVLVVIGEAPDLKPGELPAELGRRRVAGKPAARTALSAAGSAASK